MKTYAHINSAGDIVGIGMVYFESGGFTPEVAQFVEELGEDEALIAYGEKVKPRIAVSETQSIPDPALTTVVIDTDEMPGGDGHEYDKSFFAAFKHSGGNAVHI